MAAAIADFVPAGSDQDRAGKWKASRDMKSLALAPSPNILEELGRRKRGGQVLVGFALETESALVHGLEKMRSRHCDFMVVNRPLSQPGTGFGADTVEAALLSAVPPADNADPGLRVMDKSELAVELTGRVAMALAKARGAAG
jgi:phosphopantothenoylcysteine decarboxylase/phosphopantothenate--cysteine ligase